MNLESLGKLLQGFGLDQPTADFLMSEKDLLGEVEALVIRAKLRRLTRMQRRMVPGRLAKVRAPQRKYCPKSYRGNIRLEKINEVVSSLLQAGITPNKAAIADKLGTSRSNFHHMYSRHPEIQKLITETLATAGKIAEPA